MNRQERRTAVRQANKANKATAKLGGRQLQYAAFFYSPTDSLDNVLTVRCGEGPKDSFSMAVANMMMAPDYIKTQDEEYAKDPSMVADYFEQLDWWLKEVNTHPQRELSAEEQGSLATIAIGNIYWLTLRGFIKQSEYNGTMFAS